ncbi:Translation machinery-associated protein 16 [Kalmanozyma brasiliensis GHG001]|uniref:Translation machinery-associated protein 16 n=1 Tax=Kalmanozyma brasiliensis (strain GHG001) TaxID=1365824 RepID=V5EBZ6_KALBG|nr:Translation machinery-associated protein 16 [Kalmanozyma brasiliensis GHG001]EST07961.1 Translation machinery-associated protein 16 [Kalmanozyma brasiliensis GHG001]
MGGKKISERSIKKKSGPTHPYSRRATQLARVAHRKDKLNQAKSVRSRSSNAKVDRLSTLILMLPDDIDALPDLAAVHAFVKDNFLTRHHDELEELRADRRPGRPPHKREVELKEVIAKELQEYNEGLEIPDFTNATNVKLLREWQGDPQALPLFRMVRISGNDPDQCKLMHTGTHKLLTLELEQQQKSNAETEMDTTDIAADANASEFQRVGEFAQMG